MNRLWIALLLPIALLAGCKTANYKPMTSTGVSLPLKQVVHTSRNVSDARDVIARKLSNFGLGVNEKGGNYFSAGVEARDSQQDTNFEAVILWKQDGDTEVTFKSNFSKDQFDYVVQKLGVALAPLTHQGTGG